MKPARHPKPCFVEVPNFSPFHLGFDGLLYRLCQTMAFIQCIFHLQAATLRLQTNHFFPQADDFRFQRSYALKEVCDFPFSYHEAFSLPQSKHLRQKANVGSYELKASFPLFLLTWTLQGLWAAVTSAAALAAIIAPRGGMDAWAWLGALIWLAGFLIEVTADAQKSLFKADPPNQGKFIRSGLWAWSRHSNYFGEIVLWIGVALVALPTLAGWRWLTLVSPLFVILLLTRVSGIPMLGPAPMRSGVAGRITKTTRRIRRCCLHASQSPGRRNRPDGRAAAQRPYRLASSACCAAFRPFCAAWHTLGLLQSTRACLKSAMACSYCPRWA